MRSIQSIALAPLALLVGQLAAAANVTYAVPAQAPTSAAALDPAPVGVSFEFFAMPSYFTNVSATTQCLKNFQTLTGTWPPIRVGGTTQDRAVYDPSTAAYVVYTVPSSTAAPSNLTFGSSFMTLAGKYAGSVVMGLNRGHENLDNTIAAARVAKSNMKNLLAIELGNEPEYYLSDGQKIATDTGVWTPATDAASQDDWDIRVGQALGSTNIIQAGNSNDAPPEWGAAELIATENSTVRPYVRTYAHHNYPGGSVTTLMSHKGIVSQTSVFPADIAAASKVGKEYVLGETNSVAGGGAATVSPTFGAALWTMDYIMRAATLSIKRIYFHHGTVGACYYCWWGRYDMGSPYYGAYAAAAALANGASVSMLDTGNTNYAAYVVYGGAENARAPLRALLYNSDYYASGGGATRGSQTFVLTELGARTSVRAKRLTALDALARQDQGHDPSFGGQYFMNASCDIAGTETFETTTVSGGAASFVVKASEALVVYF